MPPSRDIWPAIVAQLTAGRPGEYQRFIDALNPLSDELRARLIREVTSCEGRNDIFEMLAEVSHGPYLSADQILHTEWPEPVWAIPDLLPAGLTILAGAPKMGKSWLALQCAQAVAAGGIVLGRRVEKGSVMYLALEDSPRRLKGRMKKQHWPDGLSVDFMTVGTFQTDIGDLRNGGGDKLAENIVIKNLRLIVIDTLSRALAGDQNDVREMTNWLDPLQVMAQEMNCAILLVDHHRKNSTTGSPDPIADILGSTAKGAMADTTWGLYRERGKPGAKLSVTGREIEEVVLDIRMDWLTGCWQVDETGMGRLDPGETDLIETLESIGPAQLKDILPAMGLPPDARGTIHKRLVRLEEMHKVRKLYESGNRHPSWDVIRMETQTRGNMETSET